MKKSILNLGKALNKAEQKTINGGGNYCTVQSDCSADGCCIHNNCLPFYRCGI